MNTGKMSQIELDVSRFLHNLSNEIHSLSEVRLRRVIALDSAGDGKPSVLLLIAGDGDGARLVGKSGAVVKALAKQFGRSIRVIEESPNIRIFVNNLLSPAIVTGINTVWRSGSELYRIRVPESHRRRLAIAPEIVPQIIQGLYSAPTELVFETV
jgi:transcription antitermination factor NusA-like protein